MMPPVRSYTLITALALLPSCATTSSAGLPPLAITPMPTLRIRWDHGGDNRHCVPVPVRVYLCAGSGCMADPPDGWRLLASVWVDLNDGGIRVELPTNWLDEAGRAVAVEIEGRRELRTLPDGAPLGVLQLEPILERRGALPCGVDADYRGSDYED